MICVCQINHLLLIPHQGHFAHKPILDQVMWPTLSFPGVTPQNTLLFPFLMVFTHFPCPKDPRDLCRADMSPPGRRGLHSQPSPRLLPSVPHGFGVPLSPLPQALSCGDGCPGTAGSDRRHCRSPARCRGGCGRLRRGGALPALSSWGDLATFQFLFAACCNKCPQVLFFLVLKHVIYLLVWLRSSPWWGFVGYPSTLSPRLC